MTPYFDQGGATLYQGHALSLLRSLPEKCVQTCVTSPPYYGLRAYGTEPQVWGGERGCCHVWGQQIPGDPKGGSGTPNGRNGEGEGYGRGEPRGATCSLCGAWRGELGLEPTPALFVSHLTEIFREVRRVLADDGTCWVNMGDSYSTQSPVRQRNAVGYGSRPKGHPLTPKPSEWGLASKNLLGMPWRLAFALQDDGWILRSEIIWHKPNPMPESVRDRPTKAHEQLFLLAKRAAYFYDADAIAEAVQTSDWKPARGSNRMDASCLRQDKARHGGGQLGNPSTRNRRTVWTIPPRPFREAHFATFPPALVEPCILAGTSAAGECPHCGSAWERVVERELVATRGRVGVHKGQGPRVDPSDAGSQWNHSGGVYGHYDTQTLGWRQTCSCPRHEPVPQTVLDPFSGAATTGLVALQHGRRYIGLELQESYLEMSARRLATALPEAIAA